MKCVKCGSGTRMQVQAVISAPGELTHALSKRNLRRKDVYILGVLWETANYICTNLECQHIFDGYGNYVTRLKNENQELRAELDALKKDALRYQFIRSGGAYIEPHETGEIYVATDISAQYYTDMADIDIAIDGAISEQKPGDQG